MDDPLKLMIENGTISKENIKTDSRGVTPGDVFIAVKGTVFDGHDYIKEALKNGALRILCEYGPSGLAEEDERKLMIVQDSHEVLARVAGNIFGNPSGALSVYGVTGTNGKTTTVFLIDSILNSAGIASGLVSTVFVKTRGSILRRASMTTPGPVILNRFLSEMVEEGKRAAVVEISSHALDQKRVRGVGLDSAVFTNITPEHLDYHGDMITYLNDKSRIFDGMKPEGTAVLNLDDPMVIGLTKNIDFSSLVTFGMGHAADVRAENVRLSASGTEFDLTAGKLGTRRIKSSFVGEHNVYNMLAATAALLFSGLSLEQIGKGLETAVHVPGRLDKLRTAAPFSVFVDYAHTPGALESVLRCLRPLAQKKLICVFGCGGDRDKTKRPVMGRIAAEICDYVILTNDNPRTEDPVEILKQIEKGMPGEINYSIMQRRRDAIRRSLETAGAGDIVIIAGKGHEDYQITGEKVIHFDDKKIAEEILQELGY